MKSFGLSFLILLIFVLGAIAYTWPGPRALWEQRTDHFMSDGTDLTTNPFQFDMLHREYLQNPELIFYGAFPNHRLNAPEGMVAWYSVIEKVAGIVFPFFVPVEQVAALLAMILMVLNGLSFYGMARSLQWDRLLSLGLSIAWAFSAYTRARAQVHASLVGIYALPLAVWGLSILHKDRSRKGILKASLCFLGCATAPHYYLIFLLVFSPFFILYFFTEPSTRQKPVPALLAVITASAPALLFLVISFLKPVPVDFQNHVANILPTTGRSEVWPHPFLEIFSARWRDYFSGDIAIGSGDWNPLRKVVSESIRKDPNVGNFHEHALGIRWILWLSFAFSVGYVLRNRKVFFERTSQSRAFMVFLALGFFAFLSSLPPDWGWIWGPSAWIYRLVEQIRVPNRLGIFVHFSVLMTVGLVFQFWFSQKKPGSWLRRNAPWILLALILLDFPPGLNEMPMAKTIPSRAPLFSTKSGSCGVGMHFPYISGTHNSLAYYYLLQSLRGTDCSVLNSDSAGTRDSQTIQLFGYQNKVMIQKIFSNDAELKAQLVRFAQCNNLDWMVFDPQLPEIFVQDVCHLWNGQWMGQGLCLNRTPAQALPLGRPDVCLVQIR